MAAEDPNAAGSGKLVTPCERMQLEYSPSSPPGDEPLVAAAPAPAVVVVPMLATLALEELPPPQPAPSIENAATATRPMGMNGRPRRIIFASFQSAGRPRRFRDRQRSGPWR